MSATSRQSTDATLTPETLQALPARLRLGPVHLTVADLGRSIAWYERALGLRVSTRSATEAALGDGAEIVVVVHEDHAARRAGAHAGLYHYALLYPSRQELARAAIRIGQAQTPIQGASDHGTHEAIYLPDPDGNGIELAADRPREQWPDPAEEFARGGPSPLDFGSLLGTVAATDAPPLVGEGVRVGHLHLHVGDIEEGLRFYRDLLGFEMQAMMPTAAFVSAGGYHHHLAFNVWRGRGVGPAPAHAVGLHHWTIELPEEHDVVAVRERLRSAGVETEALERGLLVRDPWQIAVVLSTR